MSGEKDTPETNTAIQIIQPADIDRLAEAFKKFQDFKVRLLSAEDTIKIENKPYLKKSAWRKWALACGVSDQLLSLERVPPTGLDDKGDFCYRVVVKAYHKPTGRSAVGLAVAAKSEKDRWAHEEHDILTLAHTRAKNRAISDITGGGEVSAEEMVSDIPSEARNITPSQEAPEKTQPSNQPRNITPPAPQVTGEDRSQPAQPDKYLGIPATTETPPPGSNYRQFPLMTEAGISVGVLNISPKNDEVAIVPKGKVLTDDPAVKGFLVPRVLGPLEAKYGFRYSLFADQEILKSIHIKATGKPLEDTQIKELVHAARWAFSKASERPGEAAKK